MSGFRPKDFAFDLITYKTYVLSKIDSGPTSIRMATNALLYSIMIPLVASLLWYLITNNQYSAANTLNTRCLDSDLVNYKLKGFNGEESYLTHGHFQTSCGANLNVHYTHPSVFGSSTGTPSKPILILIHGYPESSYIWRAVTPKISTRVPVLVPDQPGYGLSTACCNEASGCVHDKRSSAKATMEVVRMIYRDVHVVFGGHDRGARTMHRAAVDNNFPGINGLGVWMADIVPFVTEYNSFSNPEFASGYFHWAFLPKGQFATDVIMAYGGGAWTKQILGYGSGTNETAVELFKADRAWDIYINFFDQLSVTNSSVQDYLAGATIDYDREKWDQKNGTKIEIPTHVMYSQANIGSQFDVLGVWKNHVAAGVGLRTKSVGGGRGHFIIEEAPDENAVELNTFLDALGVAK